MALDERKGVWKSGRGKGRVTPKGRQYTDEALAEVRSLLGDRPRRRDCLIEFLHLIQDAHGHLSADHLRALAEEMRLSMAEVYEVATFYAHFDVVKEGETPPPALTIRVCDSLSCELAGAQGLQQALEDGLDPSQVRVLRAPCMGRCDTAPVLELGHNHIDHATPEKVAGGHRGGRHPCAYTRLPGAERLSENRRLFGASRPACKWRLGSRCRKPCYHLACAALAGPGSRRARNGASCARTPARAIWPSTATKASRALSRTASISNACRIFSSKAC